MTSLITLQFECESEHSGAAAEGVVVGVGVDAVEDGVGVVALVQEVVEFEAEDEALPFVLGGGEGHIIETTCFIGVGFFQCEPLSRLLDKIVAKVTKKGRKFQTSCPVFFDTPYSLW